MSLELFLWGTNRKIIGLLFGNQQICSRFTQNDLTLAIIKMHYLS